MNPGIIAAIVYGIIAIAGGITGYVKSQSKPSLISGTISGILLIAGSVAQLQGQYWGLTLSAIVTGGLIIVFGVRLAKTQKLMPSGLMLLLGIITLIAILVAWQGANP